MKRRELVQVAIGTTLAHGVVTVLGCAAQTAPHAHSAHGANNGAQGDQGKPAPAGPSAAMLTVAQKTGQCVVAGESCLEHAIRLLGSGDTMLARCAVQVNQMLAVCRSMSALAAMGSDYARELASLCKRACSECAAECEAHAGHHAECKACFEACKETLKALEALA